MKHTSYVIASTPRSGSSLLAAGLEETGVVGRPEEYFAPDQIEAFKRRWKLPPGCAWDQYLPAIMSASATPNGVRGIKIHWAHVVWLAGALEISGHEGMVLDTLFPDAMYVNIVRSDRRAQALSLFRAEVTGEWIRLAGLDRTEFDLGEMTPTVEQVVRLERALDAQQNGWIRHFDILQPRVLTIWYEEIDADYRGTLARVLNFLGADSKDAFRLKEPRLQRQSDQISDRWRTLLDRQSDGDE